MENRTHDSEVKGARANHCATEAPNAVFMNEFCAHRPLRSRLKLTSAARLTMEVRESLVKSAKAVCEEAKIGIRRVRQKGMNDVRKQKKTMSQDDVRMVENYVSSKLPLSPPSTHPHMAHIV